MSYALAYLHGMMLKLEGGDRVMALLVGKLLVTCPETGSEVNVKTKCVECPSFKHVAWQGLTPLIACTYKKPQTEPEKKGIGGLQRW